MRDPIDRQQAAIGFIVTGLALGILGAWFFHQKLLGLSVVLFVSCGVAAVLLWARHYGLALSWRKLWPIAPILFFSGMIAVRADIYITTLNFMALMLLIGLWAHYLQHNRHADNSTLIEHIFGTLLTGITALVEPIAEIVYAVQWTQSRRQNTNNPVSGAIVRGLFFSVPVVVVFAILLSSADTLFANMLNDVVGVFSFSAYGDLIETTIITLMITWVMIGGLAYAILPRAYGQSSPELDASADDAPDNSETHTTSIEPRKNPAHFRLGIIEATMMLGSLCLLFGIFVVFQVTYLFGGQTMLGDFTYAEYARRGFFELVTVSVLVLGLGLFLDQFTVRNLTQHGLFRLLMTVLVALTGVILVSAWYRMSLYEAAYGFTHLRIYTYVFMVALAALFVFFLLQLYRIRENVFALGVLLTAIGYLVVLNLLNVDYLIAQRNIERYHAQHELDACYLEAFSVDALPAILALYQHPDVDDNLRAQMGRWLYKH